MGVPRRCNKPGGPSVASFSHTHTHTHTDVALSAHSLYECSLCRQIHTACTIILHRHEGATRTFFTVLLVEGRFGIEYVYEVIMHSYVMTGARWFGKKDSASPQNSRAQKLTNSSLRSPSILFSILSLDTHSRYSLDTLDTLDTLSILSRYSLDTLSILSILSLDTLSMLSIPSILSRYSLDTLDTLSRYSLDTLDTLDTLSILSIRSLDTLDTLSRYSLSILSLDTLSRYSLSLG